MMTDMDNKKIEPIDDDKLEEVAGGGKFFSSDAEEERAKSAAYAEGRTYMMTFFAASIVCFCNYKYKFARSYDDEKHLFLRRMRHPL